MSKRKGLVCASCGEKIKKDEVYYGDEASYYEGKPLCGFCYYENEAIATLYHNDDKEPYRISLSRNETEGVFRAKWHSTDPWRGRYELSSESYVRVFSDAILVGHESEAMLKELNDKAIERFSKDGIDFYRAFLRTSNLFCTDYDIWVKKEPEQILKAHFILEKIKAEVDYHNPMYSTGIIFDRAELSKLKSILGSRYKIETDSDVLKLLQEKGEELLQEIRQHYESSPGDTNGI